MNPAEGAAEEGAVPDSEVDAFFRTGRGAAGKGSGQRRAQPPPRDAGLAAAARAPPAAEPRGGEGNGGGPRLPPRFVRRSPSARPCLRPGEDATAGLRSRRPPREDRPGPRPRQAQKPRGDARGEPPRRRPRGRLRRLGPAGPPPRRAPAPGSGGRPGTDRYLEAEPAACAARPALPGRSAGRYPLPSSGGQ